MDVQRWEWVGEREGQLLLQSLCSSSGLAEAPHVLKGECGPPAPEREAAHLNCHWEEV